MKVISSGSAIAILAHLWMVRLVLVKLFGYIRENGCRSAFVGRSWKNNAYHAGMQCVQQAAHEPVIEERLLRKSMARPR